MSHIPTVWSSRTAATKLSFGEPHSFLTLAGVAIFRAGLPVTASYTSIMSSKGPEGPGTTLPQASSLPSGDASVYVTVLYTQKPMVTLPVEIPDQNLSHAREDVRAFPSGENSSSFRWLVPERRVIGHPDISEVKATDQAAIRSSPYLHFGM